MVGERHDQPLPVAVHCDLDRPAPTHRFRRVPHQVAEGATQRVVVARDRARAAVRAHRHLHSRGHRRAAQIVEQLHEIHLALRTLGQPAEVGELPGQPGEPIGFGGHHFRRRRHRAVRRRGDTPQLVDGDPHRRERILDLVRHPARHLSERPQPLGLELLLACGLERGGELAQRLPQRLEVRRAAGRRAGRERHAAPDQPRPAHQLVDRA